MNAAARHRLEKVETPFSWARLAQLSRQCDELIQEENIKIIKKLKKLNDIKPFPADWRKHPTSLKQVALIEYLNSIRPEEEYAARIPLTKGEAADLINRINQDRKAEQLEYTLQSH